MRISDWSSDVCSSDLLPGVRLLNHGFFNEFTLVLDSDARLVVRELADRNILGGVSLGRLYPEAPDIRNGLVIAVTETTTRADVDALAQGLMEILACACPRKAARRAPTYRNTPLGRPLQGTAP